MLGRVFDEDLCAASGMLGRNVLGRAARASSKPAIAARKPAPVGPASRNMHLLVSFDGGRPDGDEIGSLRQRRDAAGPRVSRGGSRSDRGDEQKDGKGRRRAPKRVISPIRSNEPVGGDQGDTNLADVLCLCAGVRGVCVAVHGMCVPQRRESEREAMRVCQERDEDANSSCRVPPRVKDSIRDLPGPSFLFLCIPILMLIGPW